jgi:sugar phosphate isomerase/epimerase
MKTSFCTIGFQKNKRGSERQVERPLDQILPIIAEAGYDGVEIWNDHLMTLPAEQREQVAKQLQQLGLKVALISPYFDFTTSEESAEQSLQRAAEVLEEARRLKADGIRVFTGRTGSAEATPAQWDRAVNCLQQLADQSAADGISWACETHRNNLMDTIGGALRLMGDVNRKNVCLIFQPTTFGEDWENALDLLGPYICHVHASNYDDEGNKVGLEEGELDYRQIIRALGRYSYDGYISVEWMGDNPEGMAHQEAVYLRKLLQ